MDQRNSWGWGNLTPAADNHVGPWVEVVLENGLFAGPPPHEIEIDLGARYALTSVSFSAKTGRYLRFRALSESNKPYTAVAELDVVGAPM